MDVTDKKKVWFAVINIYAASKAALESWQKAELRLKERNIAYHGSYTGKAGNAMELTFDACMAGYRRLVAVGGDGTVHDVLNGIAAFVDWSSESGREAAFSDFTISVIPVGSGNDWIKTTGVPKDIAKSVDILADPVICRQDVVRVSTLDFGTLSQRKTLSVSYMVNVGGVGIDARVCRMVNALKRRGKRGKILYLTSLIYSIYNRRPANARVICDGKTIFDGAYLSMAFGIGKYSGGGMRQTPEAILDDGMLDVTIIPDIALGRIAKEIYRLFTGSFLKVPELTCCRGKNIVVEPYDISCTELVEVDGEVVGKAPVSFEILDSQINFVAGK